MAYFTVDVLDRFTKQPLPSVHHNGVTWIVSEPGTEFQVSVQLHNNSHSDHKIFLKIDGVDVGYSKVMYRGTTQAAVFEGFLQGQGQANAPSIYAAFRLGACKPSDDAAIVDNPDEIKAGRILVEAAAVRAVGSKQNCVAAPVRLTDEASKKRLPEGKKFFLAPGLKAEAGGTVTRTETWNSTEFQTVAQLPAMQLRYDTHEALLLRKILNPSLPAHRAILRTCKDARIARMGADSDEEEAGSEQQQQQQQQQPRRQAGAAQVKRESAAAGVKRERDADGAPLPGSATAETVDLTERRPGGPLLVGGRAVRADELAVCDLCDSDDEEPAWQVQKKQATQVE